MAVPAADRAVGRDVRYFKPDNDNGAQAAPRNTYIMNVIYAAARRAVPAAHGRTSFSPALLATSQDRRTGILSRDELRRAVAEVIG